MTSESARISELIKFGEDFELDLKAYKLRRSGRLLKLERIPMEILLLTSHRNQVSTRSAPRPQ